MIVLLDQLQYRLHIATFDSEGNLQGGDGKMMAKFILVQLGFSAHRAIEAAGECLLSLYFLSPTWSRSTEVGF